MAEGFRLNEDSDMRPPSLLNAMLALGLQTEGAEGIDFIQPGEKPGDFIRNYRLIDLLGEGGFGTVWRAQQLEPIQRELALKLIKPGMSSRAIIARFEAERQALAMMDHPNIAAVLDAGTTSDGRSFFAMELVRGVPLTQYCDENHLTIRERVELFLPVCDAVQHAHQKGILHRDLKPSNILVTRCDRAAVPKVIDFGVAKALGSSDLPAFQASMLYTQVGAVVGTLQYMSPEQAGSMQDVDTRSDIYTLGVILYELLTGCTPFQRDQGSRMAFDEALRYVREGRANMPSGHHFTTKEHLAQAAGFRQLDPFAFRRLLRGDLDWITIKALEKDRGRRYATAAAMADDLQRYLNGQPVSAVAPSWHYQFSRFASRNRLVLITACLVSAALIAGTGISLWQASQATKARAAAEKSRVLAERRGLEAEENLSRARKAVETYLSSVTEDPKLNQADFSDLRRSLLKSALPLYEEMLARTEDPSLRGEQARALQRLANLYQSQGDNPKAEEIERRVVVQLEELLKTEPDSLEYRRSLQETYNDLAVLFQHTGASTQAVEMYRRAIHIAEGVAHDSQEEDDLHHLSTILANLGVSLEGDAGSDEALQTCYRALEIELGLMKRKPAEPAYAAQAAVCYANLGWNFSIRGRSKEAKQAFSEAIAIQERLVRDDPDNPGHPEFLGMSYFGLGVLLSPKDPESSIPYFRKAIGLHEKLRGSFPKDPNFPSVVIKSHLSLGTILEGLKRTKEAQAEYAAAAGTASSLLQNYPAVAEFPDLLGTAFARIAVQQTRDENWQAAHDAYLQSIEGYRASLERQPGNETYHNHLAEVCHGFAEMCIKGGYIKEAVEQAGKLPELCPNQWQEYDFAATVIARAAGAVEAGGVVPDDQIQAMAETYRQKAVELLRQSISHGYTDPSKLRSYVVFRSLRQYGPFLALPGVAPAAER